jgi:hypothetical protein
MKEHGILFKPSMIKAVQELRKTQTRRIMKHQPDDKGYLQHKDGHMIHRQDLHLCAKYQLGDLLYIKEAIAKVLDYCDDQCKHRKKTCYKMDYENGELTCDIIGKPVKWKSPLFMFKRYARTWLKVKSVRVEKIKDITTEDATAEGIEIMGKGYRDYLCKNHYTPNPIRSFWTLWDSINAKPKPHKVDGVIGYYTSYPWEEDIKQGDACRGKPLIQYPNPWVYVYEFEIVKKGEAKE